MEHIDNYVYFVDIFVFIVIIVDLVIFVNIDVQWWVIASNCYALISPSPL